MLVSSDEIPLLTLPLMFSLPTLLPPQVWPVLLSSPPRWQRCSLLRSWALPITWSGLRLVPATWTAGSQGNKRKCISEKTDRIWEAGPSFRCKDRLIGCWSFHNKQIRLLWDRLIFIMWISSLKNSFMDTVSMYRRYFQEQDSKYKQVVVRLL